jgi:hypothetical protein
MVSNYEPSDVMSVAQFFYANFQVMTWLVLYVRLWTPLYYANLLEAAKVMTNTQAWVDGAVKATTKHWIGLLPSQLPMSIFIQASFFISLQMCPYT